MEEGGGQIDIIGIITYVNDDNYGQSLSYMNGLPIEILLCHTDNALVVPLKALEMNCEIMLLLAP